MNKTIALLIVGVVLLAMALIMVNQYMTQTEGTAPTSSVVTPSVMTPSPTAPATTVSLAPQAASPEAVLSQLEQRAANSELAPREPGAPVSPPLPQSLPQGIAPVRSPIGTQAVPQAGAQAAPQTAPAMPAWAANGPVSGQANGQGNGVASGPANRSDLTSSRDSAASVPTKPAEAVSQEGSRTPLPASVKVEPAKPQAASAKPEPAKVEAAKVESAKTGQVKTEPVKAKPKGPKTIKKIVVFRMDDEVAVRVDGSEALEYKTMHLKSPERVVVDLEGEWAIKAPGVPDNKFVGNVRIGKQADKTRIVIDLKQTPQAVKYIKRGVDGLDVRIK